MACNPQPVLRTHEIVAALHCMAVKNHRMDYPHSMAKAIRDAIVNDLDHPLKDSVLREHYRLISSKPLNVKKEHDLKTNQEKLAFILNWRKGKRGRSAFVGKVLGIGEKQARRKLSREVNFTPAELNDLVSFIYSLKPDNPVKIDSFSGFDSVSSERLISFSKCLMKEYVHNLSLVVIKDISFRKLGSADTNCNAANAVQGFIKNLDSMFPADLCASYIKTLENLELIRATWSSTSLTPVSFVLLGGVLARQIYRQLFLDIIETFDCPSVDDLSTFKGQNLIDDVVADAVASMVSNSNFSQS